MSRWQAQRIVLSGRGSTCVRDLPGPKHAPTLVLLHGLAATGLLNWGPALQALARGFRVVVMDHRGHGRGITSPLSFRLEDCADDAVAVASALGIDRFVAVGYSMGGPVAQLIWQRHPDRLIGLVLCATAARFADSRQRRAATLLAPILSLTARAAPALWKQAAETRLTERVADSELRRLILQEVSRTRPAAIVEAGAALAAFDSTSWLRRIDVPTAVLVTARDEHVPPARQLELARSIPEASTHTVEGNHFACVGLPHLFVPALYRACMSVAMRGADRATA